MCVRDAKPGLTVHNTGENRRDRGWREAYKVRVDEGERCVCCAATVSIALGLGCGRES